jgi:hypothetical protein
MAEPVEDDPSMHDWNKLSEELKESNRLAADDVVHKLRMISCYKTKRLPGQNAWEEFREDREDDKLDEVTLLAKREHERFNAERLQRHWRLGLQRDAACRVSPFLVPWCDLDEEWQDLDRAMVRCIPRILHECGYQIYRLQNGGVNVQN